MKTFCLALLVVFVASCQAAATKDKRLLGLLGGQNGQNGQNGGLLGGVLGTLDGLLSSQNGLVGSLLGQNGVVGSLLGNVLGGDLVGALLGDSLLGGLANLVDGLVEEVTRFIAQLVDNVLRVLEGIDLNDTSAVKNAFNSLPCNELCPACSALTQAAAVQACTSYCEMTCRWSFTNANSVQV